MNVIFAIIFMKNSHNRNKYFHLLNGTDRSNWYEYEKINYIYLKHEKQKEQKIFD